MAAIKFFVRCSNNSHHNLLGRFDVLRFPASIPKIDSLYRHFQACPNGRELRLERDPSVSCSVDIILLFGLYNLGYNLKMANKLNFGIKYIVGIWRTSFNIGNADAETGVDAGPLAIIIFWVIYDIIMSYWKQHEAEYNVRYARSDCSGSNAGSKSMPTPLT